jgi:hypothetical protein
VWVCHDRSLSFVAVITSTVVAPRLPLMSCTTSSCPPSWSSSWPTPSPPPSHLPPSSVYTRPSSSSCPSFDRRAARDLFCLSSAMHTPTGGKDRGLRALAGARRFCRACTPPVCERCACDPCFVVPRCVYPLAASTLAAWSRVPRCVYGRSLCVDPRCVSLCGP